MTRVLLCTTSILISLLVSSVNCQEDGSSMWERVKEAWKTFLGEMRGVWGDFMQEVKARTTDMGTWTREMFDSFKDKMNDWMNRRNDISDSEKDDMKNFIERLRMPEGESNR